MAAPAIQRTIRETIAPAVERRRARGPHGALPPGPLENEWIQLAGFLFFPTHYLRSCRDRFGADDVFTMRLPGIPPIVTFYRPDAVKEVFTGSPAELHAGKANAVLEPFLGTYSLLLLDGKRHMAQRRVLLPPFKGERMRAYGEAMRDVTLETTCTWADGRVMKMQTETQRITLDVILRTVFGVEGAEMSTLRSLLVETLRIIDNPVYIVRAMQRDRGRWTRWRSFLDSRERVYELLEDLIRRRRAEDRGARTDILSMLCDATHEDGAPMSGVEIRDELMTLLVAGHETTATALSWATHRLTRHPEIRARLQRDLDATFPDGEVDPSRLREVPYLDAFAKETLRMHPVIPGVGRALEAPQRFAGVELPAGVVVGCNVWLVHHNPAVWPDPERFDPERFLGTRISPYEFLPFGGGVRRCIGEAFALYEMRVVLATILRDWTPEAVPGERTRTARRNITLSPSGGLPIRFRRR